MDVNVKYACTLQETAMAGEISAHASIVYVCLYLFLSLLLQSACLFVLLSINIFSYYDYRSTNATILVSPYDFVI